MMAHVNNVVADDEFQIQILTIRRVPDVAQCFWIDAANECSQLGVVHLPQIDDFRPGMVLIPLHPDPFTAIVPRQIDAPCQLQPDEPLMVVGG